MEEDFSSCLCMFLPNQGWISQEGSFWNTKGETGEKNKQKNEVLKNQGQHCIRVSISSLVTGLLPQIGLAWGVACG